MPGYVVPTYNTSSNNNTVAACIKLMWTPPPQASPLLGGRRRCPGTWSRPIILPAVTLIGASIDCDYYVTWGRRPPACASQRRQMAHCNASRGRSFHPLPSPSPSPLTLLPPRCVPMSPTRLRLRYCQPFIRLRYLPRKKRLRAQPQNSGGTEHLGPST